MAGGEPTEDQSTSPEETGSLGNGPDPKIVRVVFERGVEVRLGPDRKWHCQSTKAPAQAVFDIRAHVKNSYGFRPILITERVPSFGNQQSDMTSLLLPDGRRYDLIETQLYQRSMSVHRIRREAINVSYMLQAIGYHCRQLAESYSTICREFSRFPLSEDEGDRALFGNQTEPYHEFDALVTAVRRTYESLRYIIWKVFSGTGSTPSSFPKTIQACTRLPSDLRACLDQSWAQVGNRAKDYRDCLQHYVPLAPGMSSVHMQRLPGGVWYVSAFLPDNPEAQSGQSFRYDGQIDACTYGWGLVSEVISVVTMVVEAVQRARMWDAPGANDLTR